MNLTPQQEVAATTEGRSLLVEAGAGTGKTAVLVERFLYLLERHPDWPVESIVAVTFTEKATREMRSRIRSGVEARAAAAGQSSPWQNRRRELDRLAVSTIHGLCARILRENPIAAGIDPRFVVLEEQDTALLRERAVRRALADLAAGAPPARDDGFDPFDLLANFETQDLHDQMIRLLGQRGTVDRLFARLPGREQLLDRWRGGVAEMQQEVWDQALHANDGLRDALEQLAELRISHPEDKLAPHVLAAQGACELAATGEIVAAVELLSSIRLVGGTVAAWGSREGVAEVKAWLKLARGLAESFTDKGYHRPVGADDERAADALQRWRVLWNRVSAVYDALKEELRALDFDDLELFAHLLLTAEPRDERVQATIDGINHLMVDEFQDVNEVQGEILTALAALSADGKFFGVGDAKQSIYRFRQAQVKVFNGVGQEISRRTGYGPLPLNRSFRTQASLLSALNAAFEHVLSSAGREYAGFEARPGRLEAERPASELCAAAPGCVEVIALPGDLADATRRTEAAVLARRLHELVGGGLRVWDREAKAARPVKYGDIAILFRATTALPVYEEVFKAEALPYLTVSGRGYYDRPEVRDLTALLACLHNPADDLNHAAVLRSPMFSLSDDTLYRLRWFNADGTPSKEAVPFAQALGSVLERAPACCEPDRLLAAAETYSALRHATGRVDVWTLLRMALDRTGYEATLAIADREATTRTAAGGGRGRANVVKFLQLARERGGADLSAFLQSVQDLRDREAREGEALPDSPDSGAVQLMSVHAAKGLEFPVVVLADLGRGARGGQSPRILHDPMFGLACQVRDANGDWAKPVSYRWAEWLDSRMEDAESKRLLYVACTRAADLLILSGGLKAQDSWLKTMACAWDLELERPGDGSLEPARERLEQRDGYAVRILWPAPVEDERTPKTVELAARTAAEPLASVPALAKPLPPRRGGWPVAVTHLPEDPGGGAELPPLRPVVLVGEGIPRGRRPWRYLVGNLAHRALADWDCLALPAHDLEETLARWARRGGLFEIDDVRAAVSRVSGMLDGLRRSPLYREICSASERHAEVPLSVRAGERVLHGVLDLLYRDSSGTWHLLDWKTEPVGKGDTLEAAASSYLRQMAVYSRAVEQILGLSTRAEVCFLSHGSAVYSPANQTLAREWDALLAER